MTTKRYCVIVKLKNDSDLARVTRDVPAIARLILDRTEKNELVFRSNDGLVFGWFILTGVPPRLLLTSVKGSTSFYNGDSIIFFEIGADLKGLGFSRAWTWLQRTAKDGQPDGDG